MSISRSKGRSDSDSEVDHGPSAASDSLAPHDESGKSLVHAILHWLNYGKTMEVGAGDSDRYPSPDSLDFYSSLFGLDETHGIDNASNHLSNITSSPERRSDTKNDGIGKGSDHSRHTFAGGSERTVKSKIRLRSKTPSSAEEGPEHKKPRLLAEDPGGRIIRYRPCTHFSSRHRST